MSINLLSQIDKSAFIAGEWLRVSSSSQTNQTKIINPASQQVIVNIPNCSSTQIQQSIAAAEQAFSIWSKSNPYQRKSLLLQISNSIKANTQELADIISLEQGKPNRESLKEVAYAASYFDWYAEEAIRIKGEIIASDSNDRQILVQKEAVGVTACITPWNFPLAMVARKIAPALAAGCTVLVKPAQETPLSALALAYLADQADLPKGALSILTGEAEMIGKILLDSEIVRKISFTGSTKTGEYLYANSAKTFKKLTLELGGNAALIVCKDADLEKALSGLIFAKFRNAGQTCIACNRLLLASEIADQFCHQLIPMVAKLKVGAASDSASDIGPIISFKALAKIRSLIQEAIGSGAKVIFGELPKADSLFVSPIILDDVNPQMKICQEEIFGPVITIQRFKDNEQAVKIANDTVYALANYVFSKDLKTALKMSSALSSGMVGINDCMISCCQAPFGGNKHSGLGREGSSEGLEQYLNTKYILLS